MANNSLSNYFWRSPPARITASNVVIRNTLPPSRAVTRRKRLFEGQVRDPARGHAAGTAARGCRPFWKRLCSGGLPLCMRPSVSARERRGACDASGNNLLKRRTFPSDGLKLSGIVQCAGWRPVWRAAPNYYHDARLRNGSPDVGVAYRGPCAAGRVRLSGLRKLALQVTVGGALAGLVTAPAGAQWWQIAAGTPRCGPAGGFTRRES